MLYVEAAWMKGPDTVGALLIINSLSSKMKQRKLLLFQKASLIMFFTVVILVDGSSLL